MMQDYQKEFAKALASSGALFFAKNLRLKDGRPTPYFVNMGLFRTGRLSCLIGAYMANMIVHEGLADQVDVILGPSYKGSALAVAIAQALWTEHGRDLLFEYDRKEAKTHGEATGRKNMFVTGALQKNARVYIVDDVGTTMGTKYDLLNKVNSEKLDLTISGIGLAVDREQTTAVIGRDGQVMEGVKGEDAIGEFTAQTGVPVHCLAPIRNVVGFLYQEKTLVNIDGEMKPIDSETYRIFQDYLATYGVPERTAPVDTH